MEDTYREEVERFVREILRIEEEVVFECRKNGNVYSGPMEWSAEDREWLKQGHEELRELAKAIGITIEQHKDFLDEVRVRLRAS